MKRDNSINVLDLLCDYGHYKCNIKKAMDEAGITISKMKKLTGLNYEIVKKYYSDEMVRIDKDVFARLTYVLTLHGKDPKDLLVYVPPKNKEK